MQIEYKKPEDLIPYARNARKHSEYQINQIAASIREFGFISPVVIDSKDTVIAGHGRVLGSMKTDLTEIPCVRVEHLTEAQRKAYTILDNQIATSSSWDHELLGLELQELEIQDEVDLKLLGFHQSQLENYLNTDTEELRIRDGEEWEGMPEFDQKDKTAFKNLIVNFKDSEDINKFSELIGQKITEKTRSIWYPEVEIERYMDKTYES